MRGVWSAVAIAIAGSLAVAALAVPGVASAKPPAGTRKARAFPGTPTVGALFDSRADKRVLILGVWDRGVVSFEQNLIEPALVIERTEGRFYPLDRVIAACMVEAFVVDAADPQRCAEVAGFRQKAMFVPEAVQVHLRGERPSLFPLFRDVLNLDHYASQCGFLWCRPS